MNKVCHYWLVFFTCLENILVGTGSVGVFVCSHL